MKKITCGILCLLLMAGCVNGNKPPEETAEPTPTPEETTEPTPAEPSSFEEVYSLPEDHVFTQGTKEGVETFLEHGTGILFFGFPECPWCLKYVPYLNDVVKEAGTTVMYYNIFTDKTEDHDYYLKIAGMIEDQYPGIIQYDNEGNMRIYMPLTLFVNNGKIVAYDNETCDLDSNEITPDEYWTKDKVEDLKTRLLKNAKEIKEAQDANENKGCENGCEVGPDDPMAAFNALLQEAHDDIHQGVSGMWYTITDVNYRMMEWYLANKPSTDDLTAACKSFVEGIDDKEAFRFTLESLQGTGIYDLTEDGKAELKDNGLDENVNWTEDDVNTFYDALLAGLQ